jgi:hypothetical protein
LLPFCALFSYWQELQDDLFGKEKRVKYHRKLANIRTAALSGVNTPYKSYYSSRSMLQLNQSQMSLSKRLAAANRVRSRVVATSAVGF